MPLQLYGDIATAVFLQELPLGARGTKASSPILPSGTQVEAGAYPPVVAFPSFDASSNRSLLAQLGFVLWEGSMVNFRHGTNVLSNLQGLSSNGPVALYNEHLTTLVVSPMDNFKLSVHSSTLTAVSPSALVQLYSSDRDDHVLCAVGTRCWQANSGTDAYQVERVEGIQPSLGQAKLVAAEHGCPLADLVQPLNLFFSFQLSDNLVTNATSPPAKDGYCSAPETCFANGLIYKQQVNGTIPLQLFWTANQSHSLTVASPAGLTFAKSHGFVFSAVVGFVYPALEVTPTWETGVSSEVSRLPAGFAHRTILVAGQGITSTMDSWGQKLRTCHGTERIDKLDPVINKLSYWTDNGAYY